MFTLLAALWLGACAAVPGQPALTAPAVDQTAIATAPPAPDLEAQEARVPGMLEFQAEDAADVVTMPETVQAGEAFDITITTFGGGCDSAGETAVLLTPNTAAVMVYDITTATRPDVICPAVLRRLPHTATLQFDEPGEALIQIWGRRMSADTSPAGAPVVLERRVTVEP
jgi:hypothetical protein